MSTFTVEQRISNCRLGLLKLHPFFAHLVMRLKFQESKEIPTMAVSADGMCFYNEEFVQKLTNPELMFVLIHEVYHLALGVHRRRASRDPLLWNIACDYAANWDIVESLGGVQNDRLGNAKIHAPKGCYYDPAFRDMTTEEIYDHIVKNATKISMGGIGEDIDYRGSKGMPSAQIAEEASKWDVYLEAAKQQAEKQQAERDTQIGRVPLGVQKYLKELKNPKIHWAEVLADYLGEHAGKPEMTYQRPSRRAEAAQAILQAPKTQFDPDVVVLWDTSGSMCGEEDSILTEVLSMCRDMDLDLRVIACDCAIQSDSAGTQLREVSDIEPFVKGGGGSDFTPAFNLLQQENFRGVVVAFTDGYIGVPTVSPLHMQDTIWVLTSHGTNPTGGKWGRVLRLDKDKNGAWDV